jgi:hypothetical protein
MVSLVSSPTLNPGYTFDLHSHDSQIKLWVEDYTPNQPTFGTIGQVTRHRWKSIQSDISEPSDIGRDVVRKILTHLTSSPPFR